MMSFVIRSKHLDAFQLAVGTSMLLHALVVFLLPGFDFSKEHETDFLTVELESYEPPTQEQVEELETVDPPTYRELERPMNKAEVPDKVVEPPQVIPDPQVVSEPEIPKLEPQVTPVEIPVRRSSQQTLSRPKAEFIPRKAEAVAPQIPPEIPRNEVEIEPFPTLQERVVELPLNRPKVERQRSSAESIPPPKPNMVERSNRPSTPQNAPSVAPISVNPVVAQPPPPKPEPKPEPKQSEADLVSLERNFKRDVHKIVINSVRSDSLLLRRMPKGDQFDGAVVRVVINFTEQGSLISESIDIEESSGSKKFDDFALLAIKRSLKKLERITPPKGITRVIFPFRLKFVEE